MHNNALICKCMTRIICIFVIYEMASMWLYELSAAHASLCSFGLVHKQQHKK
jgi:hypothetical protein